MKVLLLLTHFVAVCVGYLAARLLQRWEERKIAEATRVLNTATNSLDKAVRENQQPKEK